MIIIRRRRRRRRIKPLFQEATHLTTRQSSMKASSNRKQLTNKLKNACTCIYIQIELTSDYSITAS